VGVVGKGQAPEMFPLVVVVGIGKTWYVVAAMVMMMIRIQSLLVRFLLLPGRLSKAIFNRAQNLHLSGLLLPY